ncbi:hypothetical protein PsYK624_079780 [Phanerochaete sordida]|uniref:Ricin B lectin domain-containing protein n=1 Tax=Phanerochaete sordida TaxID=48140 RepID=A0A9P3LFA6_9APHY|nr:hypothetical protein PsYK624_079780 [Phanerochaete sordida]
MADKPSPRPPPIPFSSRPSTTSRAPLSLVADSPSRSETALSVTAATLSTLKDVLEALDTLPCVKYIASIGLKILETVDSLNTIEKGIQDISIRARDIVLAVARSCQDATTDISTQLEEDLKQLTSTMSAILLFTEELASRSKYKKVFYKSQDAASIVSLDSQLTHAFQIFEINSSVAIRLSQQIALDQLRNLSITSPTSSSSIANCILDIAEGLYLILNVAEGRVIESGRPRDSSVMHAYVAPFGDKLYPYQLWVIFRRDGIKRKYTIRSIATGMVLDEHQRLSDPDRLNCWWPNGGGNQCWEFIGCKQTQKADYCTIRGGSSRYLLDVRCPSGTGCDYLHRSEEPSDGPTASQEWTLIRFPWHAPTFRPSTFPEPFNGPDHFYRREFLLQNIASGGFAAARGLTSQTTGPNVFLTADAADATPWWLLHTIYNGPSNQAFAFATGQGQPSQRATLDHWGQRYISAARGKFAPDNICHLWVPVPYLGAFVLRNLASGSLLCGPLIGAKLQPAPPASIDDPTCRWRLVDAYTSAVCPVLYDATLSMMPSDLVGAPQPTPALSPEPSSALQLRTESASPALYNQLVAHLQSEHSVIREMLAGKQPAVVVMPQLLRGWKDGTIQEVNMVVRRVEDLVPMGKAKRTDDEGNCKSIR